jgi:DNA-binding beta-propeller fold protein YncE
VTTLAGTGEKALGYPPAAGTAPDVALSSPWDLQLVADRLYIAMAGSHQLWVHDFPSGITGPIAGSGTEGTFDGIATAAELAQPSGLAYDAGRDRLYFADAESSSIRYLDPALNRTGLLAGSGEGLFDFGDEDGIGTEARFQHPLGVAFDGTSLYVADTYNSKIKRIDPETGEATTFLGGEPGWEDGTSPRFSEPGGIDVAGRTLYVADTNNDAVRMVDLDTGEAATLVLYGIERFETAGDGFDGTVVRLDPAAVAPGPGRVVLDVSLPDGYKVNDLAPFSMSWLVEGGIADLQDADRSIVAPEFPQEVAATFSPGSGMVTADVTVYFCTEEAEQLCLIDRVRLEAPVEVGEGADEVTLSYDVPPPPVFGG